MFKKRFNRKVGEIRICRICGTEWHTHKAVWRCKKCVNEIQIQKLLINPQQKKEPYPFDNNNGEARSRFGKIQRELKEAWKVGKDAVRAHYDKQFKEIEANGILEWITDRRSTNDYKATGLRKRKKYHDTIDNYETQ